VVALAVAALMSVALLTGCDALGKLGAADHYPAARSFTVSGRVTTVVIDADGGSVEVDGSSRSTVAVSQQASYTSTAPVARHVLSGTTLTLSYSFLHGGGAARGGGPGVGRGGRDHAELAVRCGDGADQRGRDHRG